MERSCKQPKIGGFTLIELLVVIAIIALLAAIVIPALHNAKLCAKQIVCASQMKQWTLATSAYTANNDDTIPVYSDVCDATNSQNALNPETLWYNRLSAYLTEEEYGKWGMDDVRRCPMSKSKWGEKAVWVGVYFGKFQPKNAPFVQPFRWTGSNMETMCSPVKFASIKLPASYLMMLDVRRDVLFEPIHWPWGTDYDGDGMDDSHPGILASSMSTPYNAGRPKIHRGGCNVSLFDGHVERIEYETFWEIGSDGYPVHPYWYNQNRP